MLCQQGNWVNTEQIDCQEFLDFVFGEGTCPKLPLEPGVYSAIVPRGEFSDDAQYVLVKPSGRIYVFLCEDFQPCRCGTSIHDLWSDISLYKPQSRSLTIGEVNSKIPGSEIAKILPEEEYRRLTQPRPFSICLVGTYGGYEEDHGGGPVVFFSAHAKVFPDGSVHWTPEYSMACGGPCSEEYLAMVGATRDPPKPTVLQVESVSRPDKWTVHLLPGQEPRLEVVYPPLYAS